MSYRFFTLSQAVREAKRRGHPDVTRDEIVEAMRTGELTRLPLPHYGLFELDLAAWLIERNEAVKKPKPDFSAPSTAYERLVEHEPGLRPLWTRADHINRTQGPDAWDDFWYGPNGLKGTVERLVGWGAKNPALKTREAYDVVYDELVGVLQRPKEAK